MARYKLVLAKRADQMLLRHTEFLTRVSIPAAKQFYIEFRETLQRMEEKPHQFPTEDDLNLPKGQYRKALFARWYKVIFAVDAETVYLDAVIDCRMDNKKF